MLLLIVPDQEAPSESTLVKIESNQPAIEATGNSPSKVKESEVVSNVPCVIISLYSLFTFSKAYPLTWSYSIHP